MQQETNDEQLPSRVAEALMTFVRLDKDSDGYLDFKELKEAMENNDLLKTDQDRAVYSGLVRSDGTITQKQFREGLKMLFSQEDDSSSGKARRRGSTNWTASTIYKGLQLLLEAKDDDDDDDDDEGDFEISPQAKVLANALFQSLDVDGNGIITVECMRKELTEVNPEMFSDEVVEEIVASLDDTGTTTITEEEFTGFFSMLASTNDLGKVRKNIERYRNMKEAERNRTQQSVDDAVSHIRNASRDSSDDTFEESIDLVNSRTRELERQVRLAKNQATKINRRYQLMIHENESTEESTKKLADENREMEEELRRNERQQQEWQVNKTEYKTMAEAMESRLKAMEAQLDKAKKEQQMITSERGRMGMRRPSLVDRLERDIEEKNALLNKTTKEAKQQQKLLEKATQKQRAIDNKMEHLAEKARQVKRLEEEKKRLESENQQLNQKSESVQQLLNEKSFEDTIGMNPHDMATGKIGSEAVLNAHVQSMGGHSLEDVEELAEQTRNIEIFQEMVDNLEKDLESKERELRLAEDELRNKEQDLMDKDLDLTKKDRELLDKQDELEKEIHKNQQPLPLQPTKDPNVFIFGTRKVTLKVISGIDHVRVGGGYVRIREFIKKYNNIEKRRLRQQGKPLPDPNSGVGRFKYIPTGERTEKIPIPEKEETKKSSKKKGSKKGKTSSQTNSLSVRQPRVRKKSPRNKSPRNKSPSQKSPSVSQRSSSKSLAGNTKIPRQSKKMSVKATAYKNLPKGATSIPRPNFSKPKVSAVSTTTNTTISGIPPPSAS